MSSAREVLKRIFRLCGIEVRRYRPTQTFEFSMRRLLTRLDVDVVLDIGANDGAYGRFLRNLGYDGKIVSFEPLSEAYTRLKRSTTGDSGWLVAPRMALGDETGEMDLNVSANSRSSSLMTMKETHREAAPESRYVSTERVPVSTLDREAEVYLSEGDVALLKLDVQGFEHRVLAGASESIDRVEAVQVELSTVELYEGQSLFNDISDFFVSRGFSLFCLDPGLRHRDSGRLLQFDAVFKRNDETSPADPDRDSGGPVPPLA